MNNLKKSHRYMFKFYYIGGKRYHGSQRQKNLLTIEECLLSALKERKYINNYGTSGFEVASRTDRFVSARGSAFSFMSEKNPILMEINSILPNNIGIWAHVEIPIDFHLRFNAISRYYKYILTNDVTLNLDIMKKACKELEGKHNFINFSKREKEEKKTIRDMDSVSMNTTEEYIVFNFKSRAFLRQQVRRMVKKIIELGKGEIKYEDFLTLFDASNYHSYEPVDPLGLVLWDIEYDSKIQFKIDPKSVKRMKKYFQIQKQKSGIKHQLFKILQHDDLS